MICFYFIELFLYSDGNAPVFFKSEINSLEQAASLRLFAHCLLAAERSEIGDGSIVSVSTLCRVSVPMLVLTCPSSSSSRLQNTSEFHCSLA